ncbi:MAG: hypothetical protein MUC49_02550 [Raineya sp.]|jgi:hypothetical protein|nr:hypothetical protein [Raineya sp.]
MTIETIYNLFDAIRIANKGVFGTTNVKSILEGNYTAKNIYVALEADGMIKSGGFDTYLYEVQFGKISHDVIKETFQEIGFTDGLDILNKVKRSKKSHTLDMKYYGLDFDKILIMYVMNEAQKPEFIDYCKTISFDINK